jgi:brefeldin A-resistance guanine nucleotide exchange factor 1
VNILDPHDRVHTDSTRLLALGVLNTSFEVSGSRLGDFPTLRAMILDHGCKYLFQLAQSENSSVFQLTLRTISTMMNALRKHLKLQQELFLAYTLDRLAPPVTGKQSRLGTPLPRSGFFSPRIGTPRSHSPSLEFVDETEVEGSPTPNRPSVIPARGGARDLLLETLSQISSHPGYLVELFSNYDCDINAENLFDRVLDLLTKVFAQRQIDLFIAHSFPDFLGCIHRLLRGIIAVFIFECPVSVPGRPSYLRQCDGYPRHCCE